MKKFLLFLLLFLNLQIVVTEYGVDVDVQIVSAQMFYAEVDEVTIVAKRQQCTYCGKTFLESKLEAHYDECPEVLIECKRCGESMLRKHLEFHICRNVDEEIHEEHDNNTTTGGGKGGGKWSDEYWNKELERWNPIVDQRAYEGVYTPDIGEHLVHWKIPKYFPKQYTEYNCTSHAMSYGPLIYNQNMSLSDYYNELTDVYEEKYKELFHREIYNGGDNYRSPGTTCDEEAQLLPLCGYEKISFSEIMNNLDNNHPVFSTISTGYFDDSGTWQYYENHDDSYFQTTGHAVLIVGYTMYGQFICMDPHYGEIRKYNYSDFERSRQYHYSYSYNHN